ncbi:hypothetical protein ACJDU8_24500 [Clostridium sp. WILCCON 0269]|uniref:Transposase n=1 Tax=Candidatus Clostridium eludens TaxID=3381663 RepID=A0ABW8SXB3_9CLOT
MINCNIERILDTYKSTVRQNRILRIKSGELKRTDPEWKQYIKNEFVRDRWIVIALYKRIDELLECKRIYDNDYIYFEKINDVVKRAEIYLQISEINKTIECISKHIANFGKFFIDILTLNILSEHDVCQLLNINCQTFQNRKRRYKNKFGEKNNLTLKIVSVTGAEYRYRKGKLKGIYDCYEYEMPVYWAVDECMLQEMDNNKEFGEAAGEIFKSIFSDVNTYSAVMDLEGNVIKVVEESSC